MIRALIDIGAALNDKYPMPFAQIPYTKVNNNKPPRVIVIELETDKGKNLKFTKAYHKDYDPDEARNMYYYREGKSKGASPSLSFKLPPKHSSLRERLGILKNLGYFANLEDIANEIEKKVEEWKKEKGGSGSVLVVLKIDGKWPGENEAFTRNFEEKILQELAPKKYKKYWKTKGICHGCGEEKEVYAGMSSLLKFYTVDKVGFAPEVNPKIAWKEFALCKDCIYNLERGKRAVEDFLTFKFYGKDFWLIPVAERDNLNEVLKQLSKLHEASSAKIKQEFENAEDYLMYEASRQEKVISYHFVFTKKEQQALRILLHIEEVLPSVLRKFVSLKKDVEKKFNRTMEDAIASDFKMHFNFFSSHNLRETQQLPGFTDKDFFNIVDKVFRRSIINEDLLIKTIMQRVQSEMAEGGEHAKVPNYAVLEAFLSLEFLLKWGILKRKIGGNSMGESAFDEFFEKYNDFFNHPAKKGLVLFGVLVEKFLKYQYEKRESTPFLRALKNLRLTQKDVGRVFRELQNKMNEYEIGHWWPKLREGIGVYFIAGGDNWPLSPDEIGFYIAIGMSIHNLPIFNQKSEETN